LVIEELAMHRENQKLRERVLDAVDARADPELSRAFRRAWRPEVD
jgi:hypothetical protein